MWILQNVELLAELLIAHSQRHRVGPRRRKQGNAPRPRSGPPAFWSEGDIRCVEWAGPQLDLRTRLESQIPPVAVDARFPFARPAVGADRKSTRLNSSHGYISYAVFCLKKKTKNA